MIEAIGVLAVMGGVFGSVLAIASRKFEVETDPRIQAILEALPGVNCGACGFPGCSGLAEAIAEKRAKPTACLVAKPEVSAAIAEIMGEAADPNPIRKVAQLKCSYPLSEAKKLYEYQGIQDCHLALTLFNGSRLCNYGCFGLGSCAKACPFGAISMNDNGLPQINYDLCTGCGICVNDCPQFLLHLENAKQQVFIRCNNLDRGKQAMDVCPQACISCGLCAKLCPEGAITMVNYKNGGSLPMLDSTKCIQCGICVEKCPRKCIFLCPPIEGDSPILPEQKEGAGCAACGLCNK